MIERIAPNGTVIEFPDGTSEEVIKQYLSLPEYQQEEVLTEDTERGALSDIPLQIVGGIRDGVQSSIGLLEGLGDTLGEKTNIGGFVLGKNAENGLIEYKSYDELVKEGRENFLFGKFGVKDAIQLPEIDEADTVTGGLVRGVSQFATGWFTGGKVLKGGGLLLGTEKAIKASKLIKNNPIKASLAKGSVADVIAFDEESGRFADVINTHAPSLANPLTDYLASDPDDTFWEGRFKNAVEGLVLGGAVEGIFRTARYIKNKKQELNNEKFDKQLLEQDEKYLKENNLEVPEPTTQVQKDLLRTPVKATKIGKQGLVKEIEDTVFNNFKKLQESKVVDKGTIRNIKSKEFNQKLSEEEALDLGISTSKFKELTKEGLFTLDVIAKANTKAFSKLNQVRSDRIVQNLADRKYGGSIARVYDDFGKLADNLDEADSLIYAQEIMHQTVLNVIPKIAREVDAGKSTLADLEVALGIAEGSWFQRIRVEKGLGRGTRQLGQVKQQTEQFNLTEDKIKNITNEWRTFGGDLRLLARKLALADDTKATEKVLAWATKNKTWNVANEVWINALLSNPKTHIINMTSNLINTIVRPLETYVGSFVRLENAQKYAKIREQGKDAITTMAGLTKYLEDVVAYTRLSFKNSDSVITGGNSTKLDTPLKAIKGGLGDFIRIPTKFLNAEDEFFKQINYRARMYSIAVKKAIEANASTSKVVGSNVKSKKPITEFEARVAEEFRKGFDETGTMGINPDALQYAKEQTFTQELYGIWGKIQQMTNAHPYLRQVVPFVKTPINLMFAVVDRTPLGLIRKQFRDDFFGRSGNLYRTAQVRGQIATGTAMIMYANYLASTGAITGSSSLPDDSPLKTKNLRDLNRSLGFQPYSFRSFNEETGKYEYTSFGRLDPFGTFFGMVADFHTYHHRMTEEELARVGNSMLLMLHRQGEDVSDFLTTGQKVGNTLSAGWASLTRNLFSKTYLKGLTEGMQILTDENPNKFNRVVNSKFGSFIPNIYTKLVNDPFYRDAKNIIDEAKKRTGTGYVQKKYDFRGNSYQQQGTEGERLWNNVFNPFTTTEQVVDPVAEEIIRMGVSVAPISDLYNGSVDLTLFKNKQGVNAYDRLNQILGKIKIGGKDMNTALLDLINSDVYQSNLSDPIIVDENVKSTGGRAREIKKLIKRYHKLAEIELLNEMNSFISTKDKTGTFTLQDANFKAVSNKNKIKIGLQLQSSDIEELYKFSQ